MANNEETQFPRKAKKSLRDERTAKKIHEHLVNEEDRISEQDISNIKTDFSGSSEIPVKKASKRGKGLQGKKTAKDKLEEEKIKDNTEPGVESAWNILESP